MQQRRRRLLTNLFFVALLLAIVGGIVVLIGGVIESNYEPYDGSDFVETSCIIVDATIMDATRHGKRGFYVDILVNYTVNLESRESVIEFGVYDDLEDAIVIAEDLELQGELTCYYHPSEDVPLFVVPSEAIERGLSLIISGGILFVLGAFFSTLTLILRYKVRKNYSDMLNPETSETLRSPFLNNTPATNENNGENVRMQILNKD